MLNMERHTQAEKTKLFIQSILEYRETSIIPEYIIGIYRGRDMSPGDFEALQSVVQKKTLTRVDLYTLIFPYNTTSHGKLISLHLGGIKYKKHKKASIRNLFSQLVRRQSILDRYPPLNYSGVSFS